MKIYFIQHMFLILEIHDLNFPICSIYINVSPMYLKSNDSTLKSQCLLHVEWFVVFKSVT